MQWWTKCTCGGVFELSRWCKRSSALMSAMNHVAQADERLLWCQFYQFRSPRKLFLLVFFSRAHFHFAAQDANGMLWKIILPWDPNIPQYRLFQPCELSLCIFESLEGTTPHPSVTYHKNRTWKLSSDYFLPPGLNWHSTGFGPVYFEGGGVYVVMRVVLHGRGGQVVEQNENMSFKSH